MNFQTQRLRKFRRRPIKFLESLSRMSLDLTGKDCESVQTVEKGIVNVTVIQDN